MAPRITTNSKLASISSGVLTPAKKSSSADHAMHNPGSAFDLHSKGQPCLTLTQHNSTTTTLHTKPTTRLTQHSKDRQESRSLKYLSRFCSCAQVIPKPHTSQSNLPTKIHRAVRKSIFFLQWGRGQVAEPSLSMHDFHRFAVSVGAFSCLYIKKHRYSPRPS